MGSLGSLSLDVISPPPPTHTSRASTARITYQRNPYFLAPDDDDPAACPSRSKPPLPPPLRESLMASTEPQPSSRPGTPGTGTSRDRPSYLRSSTLKSHSSSSSLSSLFAAITPITEGHGPKKRSANPKSLIYRAFVPHIAVHVSSDTDELAREKGFMSFCEMLRPYGDDLQGRLTIRDSVGSSNSYDDFGVRFVGLQEMAASGERWETGISAWANGRGGGGGGGGGGAGEKRSGAEKVFVGGNIDEVEELVNLHLERNEDLIDTSSAASSSSSSSSSPVRNGSSASPPSDQYFYLHFLRRVLSALPVSPHESFSHPVACVIAISSRNHAPIETLRNLYTSGNEVNMPRYVNHDYLRYYVLVHDEDRDDIGKSTALFDQMKKHFGLSCHLLRLRSGGKTAITDDDAVVVPTSQWRSAAEELASIRVKDSEENPPLCLPETDASGISTMVREMTQMSVVPFMERCIATWNDQVASRRRGLSGRFLSMSKRYFGSSSSRNSSSSSSNYDPISGSYPPSCPEAQMRKLADFAFMLRDWKLAYNIYDFLRTDFNNDKAWKYHAAANEMTAISLILTGASLTHRIRQETIDPMIDLACYSYIARCSATFSALRCLLVAVELLRLRGGGAVDEAASWAIRARDLNGLGPISHALITERVGDVYIQRHGKGHLKLGGRSRKASMWKMLAANEWVMAGKNTRARYCLDDALPAYETTEFDGIVTYMNTLKRQAGYTPLVQGDGVGEDEDEDGGYVESERLELGKKRKSVIASPVVEDPSREDDHFVES